LKTKQTIYPISNSYIDTLNETSSVLFFDIETTGFSRQTSLIYLIGYGYLEQNLFHLTQLLIENDDDEKELLATFFPVASSFDCLLTFNGIQFDLPFLIERGRIHDVSASFLENKKQIDLFREMKPLRHILSLENAKQKTFELFLSIQRNDQYDGGQLIPVFFDYLGQHQEEQENLLWIHNLEDVIGMCELLPLLYYKKMLYSDEVIHSSYHYLPSSNELLIIQEMDIFVPHPISYRFKHYYLSLEENKRKLLITLTQKDCRLPLSPINDYVYVKSEEMVIPKALASTMDKENYCKATIKNCYIPFTANCLGLNLKKENRLSNFSLTPLISAQKNDFFTYFSIDEILTHPQIELYNALFTTVLEEIITGK